MKTTKSQAVKSTGKGAVIAAVGMDLGDRYSHWCALSADGQIVERGRVKTTAEAILEQAANWVGIPVAIENGTHSGWVSRTLASRGCDVCVANPSRWRGTAHSSKNDANDAEALARVVRLDLKLLYPIVHRSQQQQEDLSVIRVRAQLGEGKNAPGEHRKRHRQESRGTLAGDRCRSLSQYELVLRARGITRSATATL